MRGGRDEEIRGGTVRGEEKWGGGGRRGVEEGVSSKRKINEENKNLSWRFMFFNFFPIPPELQG